MHRLSSKGPTMLEIGPGRHSSLQPPRDDRKWLVRIPAVNIPATYLPVQIFNKRMIKLPRKLSGYLT